MSISELIDKYVKEFCSVCTDKKNCDIRIYNDNKQKTICANVLILVLIKKKIMK